MNARAALKEWASTCAALAAGRPMVLLRKGGVGDSGPGQPDGPFWLVPTWVHQQEQGLRPECLGLLSQSEKYRGPGGILRLSLAARLVAAWEVNDPGLLAALRPMHAMNDETVSRRFHYRRPGLRVWLPRVWICSAPVDLAWNPAWDGCVSWMDLGDSLPVPDGASPAIGEDVLGRAVANLTGWLGPALEGPFGSDGRTTP
ncbi:MAG: DUF1802 family protein [Planctomycetota bacterium]